MLDGGDRAHTTPPHLIGYVARCIFRLNGHKLRLFIAGVAIVLDRIDAMRLFLASLDTGSLAAAARRHGRSAAAVTRAVAALERDIGVPLLHRSTRSIRLTEAGERYALAYRRVLSELEEADMLAAGVKTAPRGSIAISAPVAAGNLFMRPILNDFLVQQPAMQARLILLDRTVNLVDEGFDVAMRIAHLPDSSLTAIRVGSVRRVICAAPGYLARAAPIETPADLVRHFAIALTQFSSGDVWAFPPSGSGKASRRVRVPSRLTVNTVEAAIASAVEGHGIARVLSYQVADDVECGRLVLLLEDHEPPPLPVHILSPQGRLATARVRAFVDYAVPRLRSRLAHLTDGQA
ncbi:MAG: LysR family transcriptional regulator [Hyphomicrobium sp.]